MITWTRPRKKVKLAPAPKAVHINPTLFDAGEANLMRRFILSSCAMLGLMAPSLKASCCDTVLGTIGSCICWTLSKLPDPDPNWPGIKVRLTADPNDHSVWGQIARDNAAWEGMREETERRIYQNKSLDALYVYFDRQCNIRRPLDLSVRFHIPMAHAEAAWTNYDFLLLAFRSTYTINSRTAYPIHDTQKALGDYIQAHYTNATKEHQD